jgi:exodeoxyribonuclease-5
VIDECSMVDEDLGRDLLSFGTPVLVLGDPGQLPPVSGGGFFTEQEPDVLLETIHRQARDNPIIDLAQLVREGKELSYGSFGSSQVINRREVDQSEVLAADQVLVGTNKTRRRYNQRLRDLKEFQGALPASGDKLVALRNDPAKGLLNGSLWQVVSAPNSSKPFMNLLIASEDDGMEKQSAKIKVLKAAFENPEEEVPWQTKRRYDDFDYGYALTTHKSQGSQWDNVYLFDESWAFREHSQRWLYTAITRAAEKITIVK